MSAKKYYFFLSFIVFTMSIIDPAKVWAQDEGESTSFSETTKPDGTPRRKTKTERKKETMDAVQAAADFTISEKLSYLNDPAAADRSNKVDCPLGQNGSNYDFGSVNQEILNELFSNPAYTQAKGADEQSCEGYRAGIEDQANQWTDMQEQIDSQLGKYLNIGEAQELVETPTVPTTSYDGTDVPCDLFATYFEGDLEKISEQAVADTENYGIPVNNPTSSESYFAQCYTDLDAAYEEYLATYAETEDESGEDTAVTSLSGLVVAELLTGNVLTTSASSTADLESIKSDFYECIDKASDAYLLQYDYECVNAERAEEIADYMAAVEEQTAAENAAIEEANAEIERRSSELSKAVSGTIASLANFVTAFPTEYYKCPAGKSALMGATKLASQLSYLLPNPLVGAGVSIGSTIFNNIMASLPPSRTKMDQALGDFYSDRTHDALYGVTACHMYGMFKTYCDVKRDSDEAQTYVNTCWPKGLLERSPFNLIADLSEQIDNDMLGSGHRPMSDVLKDAKNIIVNQDMSKKEEQKIQSALNAPVLELCNSDVWESADLKERLADVYEVDEWSVNDVFECQTMFGNGLENKKLGVTYSNLAREMHDSIANLENLLRTEDGGEILSPDSDGPNSLEELFTSLVDNDEFVSSPAFAEVFDEEVTLPTPPRIDDNGKAKKDGKTVDAAEEDEQESSGTTTGREIMQTFFTDLSAYKENMKDLSLAKKLSTSYLQFQWFMQKSTQGMQLATATQDPITLFFSYAQKTYEKDLSAAREDESNEYYGGDMTYAQALERFGPHDIFKADMSGYINENFEDYLSRIRQDDQDGQAILHDLNAFAAFSSTDLEGGAEKRRGGKSGFKSNEVMSFVIDKEFQNNLGDMLTQFSEKIDYLNKNPKMTEEQKNKHEKSMFENMWSNAKMCILLKPYYQNSVRKFGRTSTRSKDDPGSSDSYDGGDPEMRRRTEMIEKYCSQFLCKDMGLDEPYASSPEASCDGVRNLDLIRMQMENNFKKHMDSNFFTKQPDGNWKYHENGAARATDPNALVLEDAKAGKFAKKAAPYMQLCGEGALNQ